MRIRTLQPHADPHSSTPYKVEECGSASGCRVWIIALSMRLRLVHPHAARSSSEDGRAHVLSMQMHTMVCVSHECGWVVLAVVCGSPRLADKSAVHTRNSKPQIRYFRLVRTRAAPRRRRETPPTPDNIATQWSPTPPRPCDARGYTIGAHRTLPAAAASDLNHGALARCAAASVARSRTRRKGGGWSPPGVRPARTCRALGTCTETLAMPRPPP